MSQSDVYSEFGSVSSKTVVQRHTQSAKELSVFCSPGDLLWTTR